jgi:hypothetical protein
VDWILERDEDKGVQLRLLPYTRTDKYYRWYLSYDTEGKDKKVFLTKDAGPGSYWAVETRGESTVIQAKAGKLEDWYLNLGEGAGTLKDNRGERFTMYQAVLDRKPRPLPRFTFVELSP